jgi:hypothetical protein
MPAGWGLCPGCGRLAELPAGPVTTRCDGCEVARLLEAGRRAVNPELAADPGEVCLREELE